jgi:hypothetical protein
MAAVGGGGLVRLVAASSSSDPRIISHHRPYHPPPLPGEAPWRRFEYSSWPLAGAWATTGLWAVVVGDQSIRVPEKLSKYVHLLTYYYYVVFILEESFNMISDDIVRYSTIELTIVPMVPVKYVLLE